MENADKLLNRLTGIIKKYYDHSQKVPVLKYKSPKAISKEIDIKIKKDGTSIDNLFFELEKIVLNSPKTSSKGFFNLLFGGKFMPAVIAEMLTAVLNNTMHTYKSAGIHILLEKEIVSYLGNKIGYKNGDGIFVPGASIANLVAMIIARNTKNKNIKNKGLSNQRLIAYSSDQGHYSIIKAANIVGIGRDNVKIIKSDSNGKMDLKDLEKNIKSDISKGYTPFFINITLGTTVLGAFDPITDTSKIAKKYKIRLHADGALGGSVSLSKKHKYLIDGSELTDSFAWNPHKMMNVPILSSLIFVKDKTILQKNFDETADYLFQMDSQSYNPATKSIQCGRRNDALKVRTALKYLGDKGYEDRINKQFENVKTAIDIIQKDKNLKLIIQPECINVCFQVIGKDSRQLCEKLDKQGIIKVSYGNRKKQEFIRMVCVDADMDTKDIQNFFRLVKNV
ncbi:MAG: aminotransferase class V-fold PLP-dependent enzyme [Candidatus Absconditicoccaceae bacterium]